ncbi:MAG TPA: response regulator transcription factor, partial [Quisquiliibacterium sp.]|nr:response regulator transcription factor [Quisquiliibacterium sp.]
MNILIIDDHALVREGIALVIRSLRPEATIVQADTCAAGIDAARSQSFDLVLLDLQLPDMPGFVALEQFRKEHEAVPVVVVSGMEDRATVMRTLDLGAKAFLPKSADSSRIRSAIEALLDGRIYLPDSIVSGGAQGEGGAGCQKRRRLPVEDRESGAIEAYEPVVRAEPEVPFARPEDR